MRAELETLMGVAPIAWRSSTIRRWTKRRSPISKPCPGRRTIAPQGAVSWRSGGWRRRRTSRCCCAPLPASRATATA
jgi:hypothetical protein